MEDEPMSPVGSVDEESSMASTTVPSSPKPGKTNSDASTPRRGPVPEGPPTQATQKITKRRAARACVTCRARKVRCDVVEGSPCGNCRWDGVDCEVQESRRRKKNIYTKPVGAGIGPEAYHTNSIGLGGNPPVSITSAAEFTRTTPYNFNDPLGLGLANQIGGRPLSHPPYQPAAPAFGEAAILTAGGGGINQWYMPMPMLAGENQETNPFFSNPAPPPNARKRLRSILPPFIHDASPNFDADFTDVLLRKGALILPSDQLQSALLRSYVEFVHPYMPLLELNDFLDAINDKTGSSGRVNLILYQAVMFAGSSFVEERYLTEAGFENRRVARKALFLKAKLLYELDFDSGRLGLVQALLLMTYWYETPEDHKDTWHWMGIAISMAFTMGLYRDPTPLDMPEKKKGAWRRIWWSCFMRDRMIALGMRRPTRIKEEDHNVSMLKMTDFEIQPLQDDNQLLGPDCAVARDVGMQQLLATMCIEKAKLCMCISHMLKAQYSIIGPDAVRLGSAKSQMMLFPNKSLDNESIESVETINQELIQWRINLPPSCRHVQLNPQDVTDTNKMLFVQRILLHMVYYTTMSALHRPLWNPHLPPNPNVPPNSQHIHERSQSYVREAAGQLSGLVSELQNHGLTKYMPTSGVTVILPSVLIHLLDLGNSYPDARAKAWASFCTGLEALKVLRESYAAAGFAINFLVSAHRRARSRNPWIPALAPTSQQYAPQQGVLQQGIPQQGVPQQNTGFGQDTDYIKLDKVLGPGINLAPTTPPADQSGFMNLAEPVLYHSNMLGMIPEAVSRCNSPPQSDSGSSIVPSPTPIQQTNGMDYNSDDWDQYLQYPAEGVNNADGSFVNMIGGTKDGNDAAGMDWAQMLPMQPSDLKGSFSLRAGKMDLSDLTMSELSSELSSAGPAA
ncbi:N-terminal binuclear Zn cluster-containing protein [Lasiosphaeria hispida]|uniref:N-terminal binuclear Zn cluster-containing protein n=1 Tax=Lasiosphaeria hispida TaxID=260671 RepID=A0AAJ0HRJ2_9PEZI|nr:N-terminal binuclear Zn cluster-containing protein [Lasiosphaeria hispida]